MKNLTTMKRWGILSWGTSIIITAITIVGVFFTEKDMSVMGIVCGLSWAETAVFDACYSHKERSANNMKMAISFMERLADKYGPEIIANMFSSIIQN